VLIAQQKESLDETAAPDPLTLEADGHRLRLLMSELKRYPPETHERIVMDGYRDLLLGDNFLFLLKRAEAAPSEAENRPLYRMLTDKAIVLISEVGSLVRFIPSSFFLSLCLSLSLSLFLSLSRCLSLSLSLSPLLDC
jgi:hypothetical protein